MISRAAFVTHRCTDTTSNRHVAGLGRAPATALAYMYWLRGWDLDEAFATLTGERTCSPRVEAIRAATCDLLLDVEPIPVTLAHPR